MGDAAFVRQGEFAALMGVDKSAASKWKAKGLLVFGAGENRGKVDVIKSRALIDAFVDQGRGRIRGGVAVELPLGPPPVGGSSVQSPTMPEAEDSLQRERTRAVRETRIGQQIKNDRATAALVAMEEFEARLATFGRVTRERVAAIARELAEPLAVETDPRQVRAKLEASIDAAFTGIADQVEAQASAELAEIEAEDVDDAEIGEGAEDEPGVE